jgi:DNA-binding IclR family transcriptional regulator
MIPDKHLITKDHLFRQHNQIVKVYEYLQNHLATATMVAKETGIPQKNICRYKRTLELNGMLSQVKKSRCQETGFKAWYLTTNPRLFNSVQQMQLFI